MEVASMWKAKSLGQFFTPWHVAEMMAQITGSQKEDALVGDPACGAGIMLLAYNNKVNPKATFIGQDLDPICTKMTALNMCFFNMEGYALNGDSLRNEVRFGYKTTRSFMGGDIRELTTQEVKDIEAKLQKMSWKTEEKKEELVIMPAQQLTLL